MKITTHLAAFWLTPLAPDPSTTKVRPKCVACADNTDKILLQILTEDTIAFSNDNISRGLVGGEVLVRTWLASTIEKKSRTAKSQRESCQQTDNREVHIQLPISQRTTTAHVFFVNHLLFCDYNNSSFAGGNDVDGPQGLQLLKLESLEFTGFSFFE